MNGGQLFFEFKIEIKVVKVILTDFEEFRTKNLLDYAELTVLPLSTVTSFGKDHYKKVKKNNFVEK